MAKKKWRELDSRCHPGRLMPHERKQMKELPGQWLVPHEPQPPGHLLMGSQPHKLLVALQWSPLEVLSAAPSLHQLSTQTCQLPPPGHPAHIAQLRAISSDPHFKYVCILHICSTVITSLIKESHQPTFPEQFSHDWISHYSEGVHRKN